MLQALERLREAGFVVAMLGKQLAGLVDVQVDREVRSWEKTSDHAPVWIELADKPKRKPSRVPKVKAAKET